MPVRKGQKIKYPQHRSTEQFISAKCKSKRLSDHKDCSKINCACVCHTADGL